MKSNEITLGEVEALYLEREEINKHVDPPKPDPALWPPEGWAVHPDNPQLVYRVVDAEVLRAELFGSPEKKAWMTSAKQRLAQINKTLTKYFYAEFKDEGMQRVTKDGFVCSLKTGIKRVVDPDAVQIILEKLDGAAHQVIDWHAGLDMKEYRKLSKENKAIFDHCLTTKNDKPVFDIVKADS